MRNGFSFHFESHERVMAEGPTLSSLAQLCELAGRLCGGANGHV